MDHVSFHVDEGEVVCIVGESGCGKSVTNLSVMGLLSRGGKVTEGKVLFEDRDLLAMTEKELDKIRGDQMTMIFQDPLTSLNPVFTVGNQIMESLQIHRGLSKDEARKQAEELLSRVGMPDAKSTMKKYPHTLSGGMRQRVMIAMALSCKPKLLIADEPTTALDEMCIRDRADCTSNKYVLVRPFWIFACSLFRLYPMQSKRISSFTLVFPRSRNLWNS